MSLPDTLQSLGWNKTAQGLDEFIAQAVRDALTPRAVVEHVATLELDDRRTRSFDYRLRKSRLGRIAAIADFDWKHPRSIDRARIDEAFTLRFIHEGGAVIFLGNTGTGKTHLAKALVERAVTQGHNALFADAHALCLDLARAESTSALQSRLRYYTRPSLLCIDEIARQQIDIRRLDLLYELVRRRYEARRAVVVTAEPQFSQWPQSMPSSAATAALIDRLVHRAVVIHIDADSYRQKQAAERR